MLPSWMRSRKRHAAADVLLGDRDDEAQVGRGQLLAALAAVAHDDAAPVARLEVLLRHRGVPAPVVEDLGLAAGQDEAAQRVQGDGLASSRRAHAGPCRRGTPRRRCGRTCTRSRRARRSAPRQRLVVVGDEPLGVLEDRLDVLAGGSPLRAGEACRSGAACEDAVLLGRREGARGRCGRRRRCSGRADARGASGGWRARSRSSSTPTARGPSARAPRRSARRARWPWRRRPPPRRSGAAPCRSP